MLDGLTLDQIRTFVAIAEAGSFRAGASRVSRVQSAVSHAIGNLEVELGIKLGVALPCELNRSYIANGMEPNEIPCVAAL
jgi:Bacterial regulatory helix-turn-helix protein, lysR family